MLGSVAANSRRKDRLLPERWVEGQSAELFQHRPNRFMTRGKFSAESHPTEPERREFVVGARLDLGTQTVERLPMDALEDVTVAPLLDALSRGEVDLAEAHAVLLGDRKQLDGEDHLAKRDRAVPHRTRRHLSSPARPLRRAPGR